MLPNFCTIMPLSISLIAYTFYDSLYNYYVLLRLKVMHTETISKVKSMRVSGKWCKPSDHSWGLKAELRLQECKSLSRQCWRINLCIYIMYCELCIITRWASSITFLLNNQNDLWMSFYCNQRERTLTY